MLPLNLLIPEINEDIPATTPDSLPKPPYSVSLERHGPKSIFAGGKDRVRAVPTAVIIRSINEERCPATSTKGVLVCHAPLLFFSFTFTPWSTSLREVFGEVSILIYHMN
jgi:hypothetical protein